MLAFGCFVLALQAEFFHFAGIGFAEDVDFLACFWIAASDGCLDSLEVIEMEEVGYGRRS